jgi:hypothetical protein
MFIKIKNWNLVKQKIRLPVLKICLTFFILQITVAESEPNHFVGARAVKRCGSGGQRWKDIQKFHNLKYE